jgi:hypothetical protein
MERTDAVEVPRTRKRAVRVAQELDQRPNPLHFRDRILAQPLLQQILGTITPRPTIALEQPLGQRAQIVEVLRVALGPRRPTNVASAAL